MLKSLLKIRLSLSCGAAQSKWPKITRLHVNEFKSQYDSLSFRRYSSSVTDVQGITEEDQDERHLRTQVEGMRNQYILPGYGHKVILLQPRRHQGRYLTTEEAQNLMEEARALVDSLDTWKIVSEYDVSLRATSKDVLFTPGVFDDLTTKIRSRSDATAVFVNWPMLSGLQLASLQHAWRRPVYDRFTLVLQIFRLHARSHEARLQVALAEMPYLRSRMFGIHTGRLKGLDDGLMMPSISDDVPMSTKMEQLEAYERKLRQKLKKVEEKREFLRSRRRQSDIPLVTVLGYTNAGKTSLIRQLTSDETVVPLNKLFATLDTSNHGVVLPNGLRTIFVDTIGFLSDIPTDLLSAFRATLQDCMDTDLLVHVVDVSHSQWRAQMRQVHSVLRSLNVPRHLIDTMLEIGNKTDRNSQAAMEFQTEYPQALSISCVSRDGFSELQNNIIDALIKNLGFVRKRLRVRIGGAVYDWLYKESTVEEFEACPEDENKAIITVLFTPITLSRFQAKFHKGKTS